jgi:parvulin-like peptidyl-prolyl isomerase
MTMRSIRVSHILLTTKDLAQTIFEMLKEIDNRELLFKTFAKLAKKYSACGTRDKGGDLGFLEFNTSAKELEEAAREATLGEVGGPIQSKFGYHVFVITEEEQMGDTGIDGIVQFALR